MVAEPKIHSVIESLLDTGMPSGEPEISITTHRANIRRDGEILHLNYKQTEEDSDVLCHIIATPDGRISLSRRGAIVSDILFCEGEECHTVYSIPPYRFDMTVRTERVEAELSDPISIKINYTMNVGGEVRRTRLSMTVGKRL